MIIYFTKYSLKAGSSRVRSFDYLPFYNKFNIKVSYYPLFDDIYLYLNNNNFKVLKYLYSFFLYIKRFLLLIFFKSNSKDILIIEKELFPKMPAFFEFYFLKKRKYFLDFDDAVFLDSKFHFRKKFHILIANSNGIICCNKFLEKCAKSYGSNRILILPSCVRCDLISKVDLNVYLNSKFFVIGWVGSPTTTKYVVDIIDTLIKFKHQRNNVKIVLIGADKNLFSSFERDEIEFHDFNLVNVYTMISLFSVGLMPLRSSDWEMGKCAYKLLQYWACGIPVISSNFGLNSDLVINGINGFFYENCGVLIENLNLLYDDRLFAFNLGNNGYEFVNSKMSHEVNFNKLLDFIQN